MTKKKAQVFRHSQKSVLLFSTETPLFCSLFIFEHCPFSISVVLWEYTVLLGPSVIICGIL